MSANRGECPVPSAQWEQSGSRLAVDEDLHAELAREFGGGRGDESAANNRLGVEASAPEELGALGGAPYVLAADGDGYFHRYVDFGGGGPAATAGDKEEVERCKLEKLVVADQALLAGVLDFRNVAQWGENWLAVEASEPFAGVVTTFEVGTFEVADAPVEIFRASVEVFNTGVELLNARVDAVQATVDPIEPLERSAVRFSDLRHDPREAGPLVAEDLDAHALAPLRVSRSTRIRSSTSETVKAMPRTS